MTEKRAKTGQRGRARRLVIQALYAWMTAPAEAADVLKQFADDPLMGKADPVFFRMLLSESIVHAEPLRGEFITCLDRPLDQLGIVEHAILLSATCELKHHIEVPYRVVINEAVELAKEFGADRSHLFINGVLDKLAVTLRPVETQHITG